MYKLVPSLFGMSVNTVVRISDGAYMPFDPSNKDYQEYLAWVAEGNEPLPADEQGTV